MPCVPETLVFRTATIDVVVPGQSVRYGRQFRRVFRTILKGRPRRGDSDAQLPAHLTPRQTLGSKRCVSRTHPHAGVGGRGVCLELARPRCLSGRDREKALVSNSAILAKIPNTSQPFGVDVSTASCNDTNWILSASNS